MNKYIIESEVFQKEKSIPIFNLFEDLKENSNVEKILYFDDIKEFWIILQDDSWESYRQVTVDCISFEDNFPQYSLLMLIESQIIKEEMPKPDIVLTRI